MLLYKYKSLEDGTVSHLVDLINSRLFFCHSKLLNDPFEGKIIGSEETQRLFQNTAVLSLTRTYDNLLMWSHYSKAHYGFCFGYDQQDIMTSVNQDLDKLGEPFLQHGDVLYTNSPPFIEKQIQEVDAIDIIFNKSTAWSYEQEYRVVVATPRKIQLSDSGLREIYIGAAVPIWNEKYDPIWNELKTLPDSVQIKVLGLSRSHYGLEVSDSFKPSELESKIEEMVKSKGYR